jgi:formylglycine-generating enzyme required for sulfatase activity
MIAVPANSFAVEVQPHTSDSGFCIDQHPVSVDEYGACVRAGRCSGAYVHERSVDGRRFVCDQNCNPAGWQGPVSCLDWSDAETYCRVVGKRLPSKEEWGAFARSRSGDAQADGLADVEHQLGRDRWEWTSGRANGDALRVLAHVDIRVGPLYDVDGTAGRYECYTARSPEYRASFLGFRCAR